MSVTLIIIVVTAIISIMAWNNYSLMNRWIMNPYQVANRGQYYRLITSGFLHADWGHLIFNMLSLYFFGVLSNRFSAYCLGQWLPFT